MRYSQGSSARLVFPAMEGLVGNAKPVYEVCDSKSEKSTPMHCFEGTPYVIVRLP